MRLLDRYLLRELLIPLGFCLSGFLLLVISADLIRQLDDFQKKGLHFHDIVAYYLVTVPENLVLMLPMALLLALLYTLTNHARYHELTAMRAAGISLWRMCLPYLGVGFIASLGLLAVNEWWAPQSEERAERILVRHQPPQAGALPSNLVRNFGFINVPAGRKWQMTLYNTDTSEMVNPLVLWTQPDGSCLWIEAKRAVRINGVWTFYTVTEHVEGGRSNPQPDPALKPNSFLVPTLKTNVLALPEFSETPEEIKSELRIRPIMSTLPLRGTGKADVPLSAILNYLRLHPSPTQPAVLYTKLQARLATPWTCLVVVLIAIPFGAASGRRNVFVGVAASILICFIFFFVQQLFLYLGTGGYVPAWLAGWFPNLAFGLTGLGMTLRVR